MTHLLFVNNNHYVSELINGQRVVTKISSRVAQDLWENHNVSDKEPTQEELDLIAAL